MAKWRLGAHCGAARCAPGNGPFGATFISLTVEIIFLAANLPQRGLAKTLLPPGGLGDVVGTVPLPTTWTKNGRTAVLGPCGGQGGGGRFWPAQKRFFAFTKAATAAIPKPPRWHRCPGLAVPKSASRPLPTTWAKNCRASIFDPCGGQGHCANHIPMLARIRPVFTAPFRGG